MMITAFIENIFILKKFMKANVSQEFEQLMHHHIPSLQDTIIIFFHRTTTWFCQPLLLLLLFAAGAELKDTS